MRFVISVVDRASVKVAEKEYEASIETGLLIYVGISKDDAEDYQNKIEKFADKICTLKCFHVDGKINSSIKDVNGKILLISNFTLYGRSEKGQRLDFSQSADFTTAESIYGALLEKMKSKGLEVEAGIFGAYMEVESVNAGPINLVLDF